MGKFQNPTMVSRIRYSRTVEDKEVFKVTIGGFSFLLLAIFFTFFKRDRKGRKKETKKLLTLLQNQKICMLTKFIQ